MSIGTLEHATAVLDHHSTSYGCSSEVFRFLGQGAFRTAYLHPETKVVYKVSGKGETFMQEEEVAAAERLRTFIWQAVYVPKVSLHKVTPADFVVAMEFFDVPLAVESDGGYHSACYKEWSAKGGSGDMHRKNWLHNNGIMIPIDMGCTW